MIYGVQVMLEWFADSLGFLLLVRMWQIHLLSCYYTFIDSTGATAYRKSFFGQGTGPILYDDVECTGNEYVLQQCSHLTVDDCIQSEDAGVNCQAHGMNSNQTLSV